MSPMVAAAAAVFSSPSSCSPLAVSRRSSVVAAVAAGRNYSVSRPLDECGLESLSRSFLGKEWSGLKMSTEGLAKRSRDPQLQQEVETEPKRAETVKKTRNYVSATIAKPGVKSLIVAVAIPLILGSIDGLINSPKTEWYNNLKTPSWQPPSFLFGGTWSILYPLMGLASWLVWVEGGFQAQGKPLTLYIVQLVLNLLWPAIFFGKQKLGLALVDIGALCVALFATMRAFQPVNHVAANLMKPYFAWVIFATVLNANIWYLNRNTSAAVADHPHSE